MLILNSKTFLHSLLALLHTYKTPHQPIHIPTNTMVVHVRFQDTLAIFKSHGQSDFFQCANLLNLRPQVEFIFSLMIFDFIITYLYSNCSLTEKTHGPLEDK